MQLGTRKFILHNFHQSATLYGKKKKFGLNTYPIFGIEINKYFKENVNKEFGWCYNINVKCELILLMHEKGFWCHTETTK